MTQEFIKIADGGSKSELEEEPCFTNTDKPLEVRTITTVEMKVRMRKKDVTSCVTKIGETVKIIQNAAARGSSGGNNMIVIGYNTAGAFQITNAEKALDKLEKWITKIQFLHEQVDFQFTGKFTEEVKQKLNKLEEDMQTYRSKVSDMVNSSVEHFRSETSAPASASSSSSTKTSSPSW